MIENLRAKDVNNLHLVCRNLHQIANLQVNPKLRFDYNSPKNLESLVRSSRVFEELEINCSLVEDGFSEEKFEAIEEYISFTGAHIKRLTISVVEVDQKIMQKLLDLLPNLESLEPSYVQWVNPEQSIKLELKSTKIERVKFHGCTGFANLLKSLENA